MSFALYGLGFVVVIIGVIYLAHLMHIPQTWIIGIVILMAGVGIVSGVQSTRGKDPN